MSISEDLAGAVIAEKYELLRLIQRGGMGAVYEARNVATHRRCAVKVLLRSQLSGDDEVVKRFFREARAGGLIESEHVVAAFDSGVDANGCVYYVMECLQGEDLQQALRRIGPLSSAAAIKIALQTASGLAHAHALGIVHRDVKPANLFLSTGGADDEVKLKILDFGVAKMKLELIDDSAHGLTLPGSLLGTPLYMSPEQVKRASAIDEAADVWSLGVVLFECLSGKLPWGEVLGVGELIAAILTLELPSVQELAPWVSPELAEVVHRALARDPRLRFRNGAEFRDALRPFVSSAKLSIQELVGVGEEERKIPAARLSLADTVMVASPHSHGPVALSGVPRQRRTRGVAVAVGLAASVGAIAIAFAHHPPNAAAAAKQPLSVASVSNGSNEPSRVVAIPSAPPTKSFWLDVAPRDASVSVDDVSTTVQDGRVLLQGLVGTVHSVRSTHAGHSAVSRVVITNDSLVRLESSAPSGGHTAEVSRAGSSGASGVASTQARAPVAPSASAAPALDPVFE